MLRKPQHPPSAVSYEKSIESGRSRSVPGGSRDAELRSRDAEFSSAYPIDQEIVQHIQSTKRRIRVIAIALTRKKILDRPLVLLMRDRYDIIVQVLSQKDTIPI